MSCYIFDNRIEFEKLHYVRKADAKNDYWFSFNLKKTIEYKSRFGDQFCLILIGSEKQDDSYIMPFGEVKAIFTEKNLTPKGNRWLGTIKNDVLRIHGTNEGIPVLRYHNQFSYLDTEDIYSAVKETKSTYSNKGVIDDIELRKKIHYFNQKYQEIAPHKKHIISEQVARPGIITDHIKLLRNFTCQICGEKGFKKKSGSQYIEAHHIQELHNLLPGSYCSENIIIVCPTCHKKLHHADVNFLLLPNAQIMIKINNVEYIIERNLH